MARFRILHASDLHLAARSHVVGVADLLEDYRQGQRKLAGRSGLASSHNPLAVEALASFAWVNRGTYDVLLLSDDLATTGRKKDLRIAFELINGKAVKGYLTAVGKPTFVASGAPIVLLPGNHDRFGPAWRPRPFRPGNTHFDSTFGAAWPSGQGVHLLWRGMRDGVTLALVGADFSLKKGEEGAGRLGYLGQGRAHPALADRLVAKTLELRRSSSPCHVLWVLHFDPDAADPRLRLLDSENLKRAVEAAKIPTILCGHVHESGTKLFAGAQVHIAGTATQFFTQLGNSIHVVDVEAAPDTTKQPTVAVRSCVYEGKKEGFVFRK